MNNPTLEQLQVTLKQASEAHHEYESNALKGVRDEYWAGWYAAYVLGRFGDFTTPSRLSELLSNAPGGDDWFTSASKYVAEHVLDAR